MRVKYMSPVQALGASRADLATLWHWWAPLTYDADAKGFKPAALSSNCGVSQPVLIVANHEYAIQYPERGRGILEDVPQGNHIHGGKRPSKRSSPIMSAFMKNGRDANLPPKSPQRIWRIMRCSISRNSLPSLMTHKAKANFKAGLQTLPHSMKASAWYARKTGSACGA